MLLQLLPIDAHLGLERLSGASDSCPDTWLLEIQLEETLRAEGDRELLVTGKTGCDIHEVREIVGGVSPIATDTSCDARLGDICREGTAGGSDGAELVSPATGVAALASPLSKTGMNISP